MEKWKSKEEVQRAASSEPDRRTIRTAFAVHARVACRHEIFKERTRLFAIAVVKFCRTLPNTEEAQEEGRQLRRAASAVRRNYWAARRGRSCAEFEAKLGIVFEEADECVDCLEALRDTRIKRDEALIQEARELASIFAKSVSTAKKNTRRSKDSPKS